jgi:hypothetical protein
MSPNTRIIQSDLARQRQAMRDLDAMPWAVRPGLQFRSLGWALVAVVILAALLGLLTVGAK